MIDTKTRAGLERVPRLDLANAPTPLQPTPRLAAAIGLDTLFVKRDDNTGLALGGNKARKLEYLVADAEASGADFLITMGGAQSNHCRMTAAAAAARGLGARLVFNGPPIDEVQGNMVLDRLLGAEWTFPREGQAGAARMEEVAAELRAEGHTPYVIPSGGTNGLGILGYVRAAFELADQLENAGLKPRYVVCASGSCGTLAGLTLGFALAGFETETVGVSISGMIKDKVARARELMAESCSILGIELPEVSPTVWYDYLGDGYGIPTPASAEALGIAARAEGIILDPVYTAKALSGLIGELRAGRVNAGEPIVFMHTGGAPALFADQQLYWGVAH
jgi:D-cysteine desulfhydrase family pyridoxal phosphate-dependent enzyme